MGVGDALRQQQLNQELRTTFELAKKTTALEGFESAFGVKPETITSVQKLRDVQLGLNKDLTAGKLNIQEHAQKMNQLGNYSNSLVGTNKNLSRSLNVNNVSWQSITENIGNAVLKVGLWLVATTAVIGAIRKMQQTVQLWKDLEITLERIGITTSTVGDALSNYFDMTSDVAIRMGMPIEQTLKGMDLALRATSSEEDQFKRTATAQLMLRDAAILGNVAGMQFNQAIDILVGSLRQTGMELDQGVILLDKWVSVAKEAAVSVNDLSQGFAIMSSAAASAGLNIDQVNGIIAALSEAVTLGPVQVGNAIRALMATLYNPGSINTLRRFGVAVRDSTGEFRSFWEILSELSAMQTTGALSEEQILQIAKAAGAGQRRYAQFVALLKNWDSAARAASISAGAHGEALEANERIVNTLTNAWDQYTAAQNRFWYNLGDKSGMIADLTGALQFMAGSLSWATEAIEPFARLIKVIAQLTLAYLALKLAMMGLTRFGVAAWATRVTGGMAPLVGRGLGRGIVPPAFAAANVGAFPGQHLRAPAGGVVVPGMGQWGGGQITAIQAGGLTKGAGMRQAWGNVGRSIGRGMIKPMGTAGAFFGAVAGGLIAREVYKSNWAGVGGAIGGGVGLALGGPAGMAAGLVIGGAIGKVIEQASKSFAERVDAVLAKFVEDAPAARQLSVRRLREAAPMATDVAVPELKELTDRQEQIFKDEISAREDLLRKQERFSRFAQGGGGGIPLAGPFIGLFEKLFTRSNIEGTEKWLDLLGQAKEQMALIAAEAESQKTIYDSVAVLAAEIRTELGLQEAAAAQVEEIKKRSLDLTAEELENQISLAKSAPIAYSNMLAQLKLFKAELPGLAELFEATYPTYEDFVALSPEAYGPLQQVLATMVSNEQKIAEAREDVAAGTRLLHKDLGGIEPTIENVTAQWEYWANIQDSVLKGVVELSDYYEFLGVVEKDLVKAEEDALNVLGKRVTVLKDAKEAQQSLVELESEYAAAIAMSGKALAHLGEYIKPGRLVFLDTDIDLGRIQAILDKYENMFRGFIEMKDQTYHAFMKGEEGVVEGFYKTFEVAPEVWQAMLGELKGIEGNTAKMLEAEYNLPDWYQRPTRYWAIKSTGMKEGFGPAQTGMWELWEEFLARQQQEPVTIPIVVDDTGAVNNLENLNATLDETAASAAAADTAMAEATPWAWYKWKPPSEIGQEPATEEGTTSLLSQILDGILGVGAVTNPFIGVPYAGLLALKSLLGFQHGGVVPETGPYYLHKNEIVSSVADIGETNMILSNSYRALLVSQNYLSSINIGILGVRHELRQLRYDLTKTTATGTAAFESATRTGYVGVSSFVGM